MLNLAFRPHRAALKSDSTDEQKLFAMLKVIPKGEVAAAQPPLAFALVIDTSGSMREFADQEQASAMMPRPRPECPASDRRRRHRTGGQSLAPHQAGSGSTSSQNTHQRFSPQS